MAGRFSALTTRGRAFVAAGIAAGGCGLFLGQRDLLRVAVFLIMLPIITCLVIGRTRYRIAATRVITPNRLPVGHQATVHLRLENSGRMPTGPLLLEDQVPYVLGTRPRFVLDRMSARWSREAVYRVRSEIRGRLTIGPLTLRVTDPFGLVDLTRAFRSTDTLVVTPAVTPLPGGRLTGEWSVTGASRPRAVAADGEEDVTVREYRDGDDLRRVHWRSSARRGELMVRREEQPWQTKATLILDTRRIAHRGSGPASSLEWAVSGVASIGVHLLRRGYALRLVTEAGATIDAGGRESGSNAAAEGLLLDALASVEANSRGQLPDLGPAIHGTGTGALIAILGALTPAEAEAMLNLRQGTSASYAIMLDTPTWTWDKDRAPDRATKQFDESERILKRGGWHVVRAHASESVAGVWGRLLYGEPAGPQPQASPAGGRSA